MFKNGVKETWSGVIVGDTKSTENGNDETGKHD
jgi:hypothetical protein